MHATDAPRQTPTRVPLRLTLASTALIVLVLGVLPIVWDASVVWQIVGCVVSVALVVHTGRVVWREVFSTDPRHLARG